MIHYRLSIKEFELIGLYVYAYICMYLSNYLFYGLDAVSVCTLYKIRILEMWYP